MEWPVDRWESDAAVVLVQGMADIFGWALLAQCILFIGLVVLFWNPTLVCRFWCPVTGRGVEVAFVKRSPAGRRSALAVQSCSAFDPPTAVACDQRCVDANCRLPAPPRLLGLTR